MKSAFDAARILPESMTRSAKNWIFSPLAIVCGALLGFWIAQDAVTKIRAASEQDPPVPSRSGRLIDRPNPPGKSSSYWDGRKRPSIEDLLLGMPHERVLRFGSDDDYRRFLGSLSGSGVRLLGQMDRFRAARVGFDDLADLEGLLADNDQIEGNFLVSIPRLPDIEAQPGALPFGSATLEWLGITTDNSAWGEGIKIALYNPAGELVQEEDDVAAAVMLHVTLPSPSVGEAWRIEISRPTGLFFEDHSISVRGVPPLLAPSPEALLKPR